jgi:hypothetical protein
MSATINLHSKDLMKRLNHYLATFAICLSSLFCRNWAAAQNAGGVVKFKKLQIKPI